MAKNNELVFLDKNSWRLTMLKIYLHLRHWNNVHFWCFAIDERMSVLCSVSDNGNVDTVNTVAESKKNGIESVANAVKT